jgi:N-acetyl-gamma-glutamyl-phosphate reductase
MISTPIRVGVVGASGYSGLELLRLLAAHPGVELSYVAGNHESSIELTDEFPHLAGLGGLRLEAYRPEVCADRCDAVFVALPSGSSGRVAAELWRMGKVVIDLSGDLRLPADVYERWYQKPAAPADAIEAAVYGLTEWAREALRSANLVANPGCYPTAVLLGLLPAVRAGLCRGGGTIVIDAKSGVSGAGRSAAGHLMFAEMADNFLPYRVGRHQHVPEIERVLGPEAGAIVFTTQLLPTVRGIYASCYVPLAQPIRVEEVYEVYRNRYEGEPFVHVLPPGQVPALKHVRASNRCQIGLAVDDRTQVLMVFSAIDNLQKGAAGQAVQNFNVRFQFPEETALTGCGVHP